MVEDRHIEAAAKGVGIDRSWTANMIRGIAATSDLTTFRTLLARSILAHAETLARVEAATLDGNDIWEALFDIMQGNVPDEMTHGVCQKLADAMSTMKDAHP